MKLRLSGKFWHKRSTVVARLGNYLKQRIPVSSCILKVLISLTSDVHFFHSTNYFFFLGNLGGGYRR